MGRFRSAIDSAELREIKCKNRRFTWSNEREVPTLTKIDKALVSVDWELAYQEMFLQALSSNISDHAPLHLTTAAPFCARTRFRFEMCSL